MSAIMRRLRIRQIDSSLEPVRRSIPVPPRQGWIKEIREALGMTARQLGAKVGKNQSTITRLEKSEANETISLKSLGGLAVALDCRLVYAIVPNDSLENTLRKRVELIARDQLATVSQTMALEDQAVSTTFSELQLSDLITEMLNDPPANLWETPSVSR
ncbi:MAG TPA: mobile mystery protein A [Gemmatimonadaceae bacterium]|nr:mobile mystery protein A [Gemmatimonadaceae bacterium]